MSQFTGPKGRGTMARRREEKRLDAIRQHAGTKAEDRRKARCPDGCGHVKCARKQAPPSRHATRNQGENP